jgi:hypothetical protein
MADTQPITDNKRNPAKKVLEQFTASWDYAKREQHPRWSRNRKLYNNERTNPSYQGLTDTFVPLTFSTVETVVAALGAGRPSTDFTPSDMYAYAAAYAKTGQKPDLKALNAAYDYYWDCDNWDLKTIKTIRNGLIEGLAGEWIYWDNDKPRIINLKARDIIIDPGLKDPMQLITDPDSTYAGRRFMTTIQALKKEKIVDPKTGKLVRRYNNLSQVTPGFTGSKETDEARRDMFTGALGANKDIVEVIEIWTGKTIRSIANRSNSFTIEDRDNEVGVIPLALTRFIADEEVIYGKSIIDPIAAPQELLNDITNQSVDAVTDILTPRWELDPTYVDQLATVAESSFGTVFPFAPGSLKPIDKPVVTNGAFNERMNIKDEIREATGAESIIQGGTPKGSPTATEINAQSSNAGQRFELFVRMLEKEGFYQRAKIVYKLMRHYQKEMTLIPTMTVDGPKFHKFMPDNYTDDYEPKIQLQATVDSKKQNDIKEFTQSYQILIQDPTNDLYEAKKILYPKMFDIDEEQLDKIIGKDKNAIGADGQSPQLGPDGQPLPEGADPNAAPVAPPMPPPSPTAVTAPGGQVHESADLVKLYQVVTDTGVRAQILEMMGFEPSGQEEPDPKASTEPDLSSIFGGATPPNPQLPTTAPPVPTEDQQLPAEVPA